MFSLLVACLMQRAPFLERLLSLKWSSAQLLGFSHGLIFFEPFKNVCFVVLFILNVLLPFKNFSLIKAMARLSPQVLSLGRVAVAQPRVAQPAAQPAKPPKQHVRGAGAKRGGGRVQDFGLLSLLFWWLLLLKVFESFIFCYYMSLILALLLGSFRDDLLFFEVSLNTPKTSWNTWESVWTVGPWYMWLCNDVNEMMLNLVTVDFWWLWEGRCYQTEDFFYVELECGMIRFYKEKETIHHCVGSIWYTKHHKAKLCLRLPTIVLTYSALCHARLYQICQKDPNSIDKTEMGGFVADQKPFASLHVSDHRKFERYVTLFEPLKAQTPTNDWKSNWNCQTHTIKDLQTILPTHLDLFLPTHFKSSRSPSLANGLWCSLHGACAWRLVGWMTVWMGPGVGERGGRKTDIVVLVDKLCGFCWYVVVCSCVVWKMLKRTLEEFQNKKIQQVLYGCSVEEYDLGAWFFWQNNLK